MQNQTTFSSHSWCKFVTIILHLTWHIAFLAANISATIIGSQHIKGCSTYLAYWTVSYSLLCILYYLFISTSIVICCVQEQQLDSQTESLFQTIKIVQQELGIDVNTEQDETIDFNQISVSLSPTGQEHIRNVNYINLVFGMIFVCSLCIGCFLLGFTVLDTCNYSVYVISTALVILTFLKVSIYVIKSIVS